VNFTTVVVPVWNVTFRSGHVTDENRRSSGYPRRTPADISDHIVRFLVPIGPGGRGPDEYRQRARCKRKVVDSQRIRLIGSADVSAGGADIAGIPGMFGMPDTLETTVGTAAVSLPAQPATSRV
jgi:hypothetical protein